VTERARAMEKERVREKVMGLGLAMDWVTGTARAGALHR